MTTTHTETNLITEARVVNDTENHIDLALGSMMKTIQRKMPVVVQRVPCSPGHHGEPLGRAAFMSISWTDQHGKQRYVLSVASTGSYWVENAPRIHSPAIVDQYSVFDKMFSAIDHHYEIKTFVDQYGNAVVAWDRASHGNCPAVILTPDGRALTYYNAPDYVRENFYLTHEEDPSSRERYFAVPKPLPFETVVDYAAQTGYTQDF